MSRVDVPDAGVVVDEVEVLPSDPPQRPTSVPQALQQNMPLASVSLCFTSAAAHCHRQTAALARHGAVHAVQLLRCQHARVPSCVAYNDSHLVLSVCSDMGRSCFVPSPPPLKSLVRLKGFVGSSLCGHPPNSPKLCLRIMHGPLNMVTRKAHNQNQK